MVEKSRTIGWEFQADSLLAIRGFFDRNRDNPFVVSRIERNLCLQKPSISKELFWYRLIACLLTTQQNSSPNGPVVRFLRLNPFPLSLESCRQQGDLKKYVIHVLRDFGGIRRYEVIAGFVSANLQFLETGGWKLAMEIIEDVRAGQNQTIERQAARSLDDLLKGIGPKQSRSLLQQLGLTRFEVPIDSRMTDWLTEFGFPIDKKRLVNRIYFESAVDGFQRLAKACSVAPCVLDAAIFASRDHGEWTDENVV